MVKVFQGTENEYYMDGYMKENLDKAKSIIKKDWDMIFCYDGPEGSGKSVKAMQDAYYCDPTLTLDRVTFGPREFKEAVLKAEKFQAIIFDEAFRGLSSKATMTRINRTLVNMLAEIRQKNLYVFVVMPTFFDLERYVALFRTRALIHVYTRKFERGYFAFYNIERKKDLYILGKKFYSYKSPSPNFYGRFTNHYCLNESAYRQRKYKSLKSEDEDVERRHAEKVADKIIFERLMALDMERVPVEEQAELLGITVRHFYRKKKDWEMSQAQDEE